MTNLNTISICGYIKKNCRIFKKNPWENIFLTFLNFFYINQIPYKQHQAPLQKLSISYLITSNDILCQKKYFSRIFLHIWNSVANHQNVLWLIGWCQRCIYHQMMILHSQQKNWPHPVLMLIVNRKKNIFGLVSVILHLIDFYGK